MTTLRISIVLPTLAGGGAERLHVNLASAWEQQGHRVEFALMSRIGDLLTVLPRSIPVVDLQASRIRSLLVPLFKYFRSAKPDITVAAMWPITSIAIFAWLLAGRPGKLFVSDHSQLSMSVVQELSVPRWLLGTLVRTTYPQASGIITVSEGVKRDLCRLASLPPDSVKVIYNPAASGRQLPKLDAAARALTWGSSDCLHILSVGTLKPVKDHKTLIEAFALLSPQLNAKLSILGEGSLRPELEALIRRLELQDRVMMPGFILDPYPWYQTADLFVLSSLWEGFGNVIVEALECGLPVVSTGCQDGPAEILENGRYGSLVGTQDKVALAKAMDETLRTPTNQEELKRRAQDFSISKIAAEYLDFFCEPNANP